MRYFSSCRHQRAELIRTVDALSVCDGARGAQSVVVLLVAHQRVHAEDGCDWPRRNTQKGRKDEVSYLEEDFFHFLARTHSD